MEEDAIAFAAGNLEEGGVQFFGVGAETVNC
jgi:hypothetical protein